MKNSSVRRPDLGNTSVEGRNNADLSVGDIMRQAKKALILKRIIIVLLVVILIFALIYFIVTGYAANLVDRFFSLMD